MIEPMGEQTRDRAAQQWRLHDDIGISKEEKVSRCGYSTSLQGMILSQPTGRKSVDRDKLQFWIFLGQPRQDISSSVGGAIIDDDNFFVRVIKCEDLF
jgi:hypothetical protein